MTISTTVWIILAGAAATYLTRIGGHCVISRFDRLHPRVEAALDAVPAAVLTTIVAPAATAGGPPELTALAVAALVGLRFSMLPMFLAGAATLLAARALAG
jgi:uncharacterized membrane protein